MEKKDHWKVKKNVQTNEQIKIDFTLSEVKILQLNVNIFH